MKLLQSGIELVGNVGWGVVRNSGRCLYGGGQAVVGMVSEDDELIGQGLKNIGRGAVGLTLHTAKTIITGNSCEDETENIDVDTDYDI